MCVYAYVRMCVVRKYVCTYVSIIAYMYVCACAWCALQRAAVWCSVVQCGAVRYSVLQCAALCYSLLQCAAVCRIVLQCAAVCCSMLQCAAVCCSCSVLQRVTVCDMTHLRVDALVGACRNLTFRQAPFACWLPFLCCILFVCVCMCV